MKKRSRVGSPISELTHLEAHFPGGFTVRDEANALTAFAFRNGFLEDLHAGKPSPLTEQPGFSRITQGEMRTLMIDASSRLAKLLSLKATRPDEYRTMVMGYSVMYCKGWER